MKKHNILKVLLLTIFVMVICSWVFPSASFQDVLVEGERIQAGLFDMFAYPMIALQYFGNILLYVFACGIFYGVAYKIPAYHQLVDKIVDGFRGIEHFFLGAVIVLIAGIVSVTGISVPILFVFPFIIDVVLKMGYNRLVAATVTVGATVAGIAGTTLGVMTTLHMNELLQITVFDEMISKIIILVIFVILLIAQVILYGKKTKDVTVQAIIGKSSVEEDTSFEEVKEDVVLVREEKKSASKKSKNQSSKTSTQKSKSSSKSQTKSTGKRGRPSKNRAAMAKENSETLVISSEKKKKPNIWPFAIIFDLVLIILAISAFDWVGLFDINWFQDATKAVTTYELFDFQIFGKILGQVSAFGEWTVGIEMPAFLMIATCILALIYRVKWDDFIDGICVGFKKAMKPAVIILLAYVVLVIVTYHPFQLVFTKVLLEFTSGINIVTMSIVALLASFFNVDFVYVAQNILPYLQTVITDAKLYPLIGLIFQSIYGLVLLIAPTSFLLMATLSYLDISYKQWVQYIWKLFLTLLAILVVIFLIVLAL